MHENSVGCVCMVWPYPGWRADASVFSPSGLPACFSSSRFCLRSLHGSIMGCDLGRGEMRERRRESCECFVHVLLCPTV